MNKLFSVFSLIVLSGVFAAAQTPDGFKKGEVFAGYSRGAIDGDTRRFFTTTNGLPDSGKPFHGFEVSGVYNVSRYVGIKGDFSGHYENGALNISLGTTLPRPTFAGSVKNSLYNVLGGVQFKDNARDNGKRFKPFAHILAGVAQAETTIDGTCSPAAACALLDDVPQSDRERGFAGAFGGGVDMRLSNRFDLRLIQIDYNPVVLNSGTLHNIRIGVGIVIK